MENDSVENPQMAITYATSLSSVVSLLPVDKPDTPYIYRTNGIVTVTTTPLKGKWTYGKIPRLFLMYVQTLIKQKSDMVDFDNRTVHIDENLNTFCAHAGIVNNGQRQHMEQMLDNLVGMTFQITNWFKDETGHEIHDTVNVPVADTGRVRFRKYASEPASGSYIKFSPMMWAILNEKPIPLNREIALSLGRSARALDIYQWLARRTYCIKKPTIIPWDNLRWQFDSSNVPLYKFKERFKNALQMVQRNWPELHVEALQEGLKVYPCVKSLSSKKPVGEPSEEQGRATADCGGEEYNPF